MTSLYGPVDPLVTVPRYTTVATVKDRLRIPVLNVTYDTRITQAIVAAEIGIDYELGRSFPDPGLAVASAVYVYEGLIVADPPGPAGLLRTGSTVVYLDHDPLGGILDPEPASFRYVSVHQPGGRQVVQSVTSITEASGYTILATAADSGSWATFTIGQPVTVQALIAKGPTGIPEPISAAATAIASAIYKGGDAPTGTAGSDDWIGTLEVSELVRAEFRGNPLLRGFHVTFGVA